MSKMKDLHREWNRDPKFRKAYEELDLEYELVRALVQVRSHAGLTQEQLAKRMKTTQSTVARLEGGHANPSTKTLEKFAQATGTRLKIIFEPAMKSAA
ncbi:MAG: helix-turn-helix transcriptional regulator [Gammaproteobacteria bacterium]|nr:helix-turn-helix transcriptional regulator [Gammaproteobacteria bacterium]